MSETEIHNALFQIPGRLSLGGEKRLRCGLFSAVSSWKLEPAN